MAKAEELYPLPEEERRELLRASMMSEATIAAAAIVGAFVLTGLETGDWLGSLAFGWFDAVCETMTLHWIAVPLTLVSVVMVVALDRGGLRFSELYRKAKHELVQGLNGELPRVGIPGIVLVAVLAGVCEEFLFRYVLIGLLSFLFGLVLAPLATALLALAVATVVFCAIHVQYRDVWSVSTVLVLSLLLGTCYLVSGSLLAVMIAHAVYDAAILLYERRMMVSDPNYFGGEAPVSFVRDLVAASKKEPVRAGSSAESSRIEEPIDADAD